MHAVPVLRDLATEGAWRCRRTLSLAAVLAVTRGADWDGGEQDGTGATATRSRGRLLRHDGRNIDTALTDTEQCSVFPHAPRSVATLKGHTSRGVRRASNTVCYSRRRGSCRYHTLGLLSASLSVLRQA